MTSAPITSKEASARLVQPTWFNLLGRLVDGIGSPSFPDILTKALQNLISFKYTVTFAYTGSRAPLCLNHNFPNERYVIHVSDYQSGPYLLDPLYKAGVNGVRSGAYRLKDVAPDQFYKSEYYKSYYSKTGPVDELAFFLECAEGWNVVTSLMRPHSDTHFSDRELRHISLIEPLLRSICLRHWELDSRLKTTVPLEDEGEALKRRIRDALKRLDNPPLTPRETEVVGLVLQGHSSESVARILEIATGTVRIHRKNVYSKMRISSQQELFAAFMSI